MIILGDFMNLMNDEKHYNTLSNYYKAKYGKKVVKISLNLGLTCPNKDGKKGYGGCIYCSKLGSGDFAGNKEDDLKTQFNNIKQIIDKKWPNSFYIPYFQANTNTYAPLSFLKEKFLEATTLDPNVKEISIGTRCDCLEDEKIEFLGELNEKIHIQVELGLQSSNERTGILLNRCHTNLEFESAVKKLKEKNIEVVVHIMIGLPGETLEDNLNTINFLNGLHVDGIKIHELCIIKDTKIAQMYEKEPWHLPTLDEYTNIVVTLIRHLEPNIIIHRLSADMSLDELIAPLWTHKKMVVMNEIDKKMRKLNAYQGDLINPQ